MSNNYALNTVWHLLRRDAARWVQPQGFSDPQLVTPMVLTRLLLRHPSLRATTWMRIGTAASEVGVRGFPSWVQRRLLRLYGIELQVGAEVGGGLYIAHPVGCVLAADSIGDDVTVISQVTFGTRDDGRWPTIGDRTFFGAGCRILGGVTIGTGARIGANAVVLTDVGPGEHRRRRAGKGSSPFIEHRRRIVMAAPARHHRRLKPDCGNGVAGTGSPRNSQSGAHDASRVISRTSRESGRSAK